MLGRQRAALGLAVAQLRHHRTRTALAVLGVTLAVLLVVLLAGLGVGVTMTGDRAMGFIQADLWVSGGPVTLAPSAIGGVENPIQDSHRLADRIERRDGVADAQPLAFQTVYVSPNPSGFDTVIGVGGLDGRQLGLRDDSRFTPGDVHYADGTYEGPMTHEAVIGRRLAERYDLSVGDTLHVGGTLSTARDNAFEVVAIRDTFSRFLGAPTVAVHLSELQTVSGTTGTDPAAIVGVRTEGSARTATVQRDLEASLPEYRVRTSTEQVRAIVGGQAALVASAVTLVVTSVVVGVVLVVNTLATVVYQQRRQLAALKAAGVGSRTLLAAVVWQGVLVGGLGGLLAVLVTPPASEGLNRVTRAIASYPLVSDPPWLMGAGFGLALVVGVVGSAVAGWRVVRLGPLEHLE